MITFIITTLLLVLIIIFYSHHDYKIKKEIYKQRQELERIINNEKYIKTILDKLPVSGDPSLDTYRRITLDTQLRGILEQQRASELKEKEIQASINNAINVASAIQNQTINNYNGGNN